MSLRVCRPYLSWANRGNESSTKPIRIGRNEREISIYPQELEHLYNYSNGERIIQYHWCIYQEGLMIVLSFLCPSIRLPLRRTSSNWFWAFNNIFKLRRKNTSLIPSASIGSLQEVVYSIVLLKPSRWKFKKFPRQTYTKSIQYKRF